MCKEEKYSLCYRHILFEISPEQSFFFCIQFTGTQKYANKLLFREENKIQVLFLRNQ